MQKQRFPIYSVRIMAVKNLEWSGTYNASMLGFAQNTYNVSGVTFSQSSTDPTSKIVTKGVTGVESVTGTSTSTDLGNGTADNESKVTFANLVTSTSMELPPDAAAAGMPNLSYTASAPTGNYVTTTKGVSTKAAMELMAFLVAHPSKELLVKDQAILKEKLLAALPLFTSIDADSTIENVSIETSLGKFLLASMGTKVAAGGLVKNGRIAEGLSINGLTLPEGLPLPPWSKGLLPTSLSIGFDLSDFDGEAVARKFITEMDLSLPTPVPAGSEMAYLAAVAPKNSIKLTIPPGHIQSELFTLNYEAVTDISFGGMPNVAAKFSMKGMDAVIAQLQQAAADPMAQQAMAGLFAMKGIGKADGDVTVWEVTTTPDGKVMVNGTDISAMMGAMAPPPAP